MTTFKPVFFIIFIYIFNIKSYSQNSISENQEVISIEKNILQTENTLFLNKGIWGIHYLKNYANIIQFNVNNKGGDIPNEFYKIERSPNVSGIVKGNVNLFRHLLPKNQSVKIINFNTIQFNIINNQPIEVILMQENLLDWNNRLRYTIPINTKETEYNLKFDYFVDGSGNVQTINDIKTVVFSVVGDYVKYIPFSIKINKLAFGNSASLLVEELLTEDMTLRNFPNPFKSITTVKLPVMTQFADIKVIDVLGRTVDEQSLKAEPNGIHVVYNSEKLSTGIYKYLLKIDSNKNYYGTFVIE